MKIADYGKAITSYIESPTREQKELSKLRAEETNRTFLADGTPPPRKPKELKDLYKKIDTAVLAIRSNTIAPEFILPNLESLTQEYISDGLISGEDARKFAIERKDYYDNFISKNVGETVPAFDFDNEGKAIELSEEQIIERINEADGGRVGFSKAGLVKKLLEEIPVTFGQKADLNAQRKFAKAFLEYAQKKFAGNFSKAAESIGESREKIKGIFDRIRLREKGTRKGADVGRGSIKQSIVPTPKNVIPYKEATTLVKENQNFLKNKIKNFKGNEFYNAKDIANILGIDASNKKLLDTITDDLRRFKVISKTITGAQKEYNLKDAVNKITKGYEKKLVKGQRLARTERDVVENRLDPDLKDFFTNFKKATRDISKSEGIFVRKAVEDVGHPLSIKITDKYPKLTKNSNINKINTLTFQDPIVNQRILEATGYESKHDILFQKLNKLVGKKIGPKELKELQEIKSKMNALYSKVIKDVSDLSKKGTTIYNPRTKETTFFQGKYFQGQENRIPKIDINIPKIGQTFKSENLFVDMSNVNPAFRVGLVDDINPSARFFKDLSKEQKEIYKRNVLDQTKFNLDKFYTKAGFPKEQVNELKDALEFGTAEKIGIATAGTLFGTAAAAEPGVGITDAAGLSMGEKLAGAGTAAGAYKFRKPIIEGVKGTSKLLGKTLNVLTPPLFALDLYDRAQAMKDTAKNITAMEPGMQQDRAVEDFAVGDYRGYGMAGGGIATLAGVDKGPPPERGPNPQGLSSLKKRGMKI